MSEAGKRTESGTPTATPTGATRGIRVGDRLPKVHLPMAGTGTPRPLRGRHREAMVVVALHDPQCDACADYLRRLAASGDRFALWDGRVVGLSTAAPGPAGVDVLIDTGGDVHARLDGRTGGPGVFVADRYGQVFLAHRAGPHHQLPEPRELEEWLQYLATQCPE